MAQSLAEGFTVMVDEVVAELSRRGHPNVRAAHAFALRAVHGGADSAAKLARSLGVSRHAAAKTVAAIEGLGYVERVHDPSDARGKRLQVTARGRDMIDIGGQEFDAVRNRWAAEIGTRRLNELQADLAVLARLSQPRPPETEPIADPTDGSGG